MKLLACVTFVQYLSASNIYSAVNSPCLLELELALCTNLLIQAVTRNTFFSLLYFSKSSTGSTSLWSLLLLNCAVLCLTCFSSLLWSLSFSSDRFCVVRNGGPFHHSSFPSVTFTCMQAASATLDILTGPCTDHLNMLSMATSVSVFLSTWPDTIRQ